MTNKIVILDNSIELYEHYIDDAKWERTLAFPRGGVTYLVSNGTIKFYAYEDYLYRNCLISMQLPIYVLDEKRNIDGEYENINDLTKVLDPIFPSNDIDAELEYYLSIADAERTYQPIGDYALKSEIQDVSNFVTDEELVDALDDYVEKEGFNTYTAETAAVIEELDDRKADKSELSPYFDGAEYDKDTREIKFYHNGEVKTHIDATPFIKDGMVNSVRLENGYLIITFNTDAGKEPISIKVDYIFEPSNYYTKAEIGDNFQPIGNYVSASTYTSFTSSTEASIQTLRGTKLDISAYTPSDLSNYYTKSEVYSKGETYNRNEIDDKIIQSGTFDPTLYYTKDNCNTRFALKDEMPSLNGYATEEWVTSKNYATNAELVTYVNNLQQQINSLMATVSGCCGTQEDVYRWITIIGEYICDGNDKYEKQKYQVSHDGGMVWQDVTPIQYQKGQLLESESEDCGYVPEPQYRWKAAPTSDYMCSGTSKYYKEYYQVSYDGGQTWENVSPEQTKIGGLIESNSSDCGYVTPQYRWLQAPSTDYVCSGTTKHFKEYYQVSNDGGETWENVSPEQTRTSIDIIESNSADCGYVPSDSTKYLTFIPSENGTFMFTGEGTIPNTASYSLDSGSTWVELESGENTPTITSGSKIMWKGSMIPASSSPMFGVGTFSSTCMFAVEGNPMSLIYNDNFANQKSLSSMNHTFHGLFKNCTKLTSIEHLVLPATTLADYCYMNMFEGCISLTTVPSDLLPATTLTDGCYSSMFSGCKSLTSMVYLPATRMKSNCYNSMYSGCISLTTAKKLPSTILEMECYELMFSGCTNLTTVPSDMLPATKLHHGCYRFMFYGCSKMTTAPILPAETLVTSCYNGMFGNCSNLNYIKCLATSINVHDYTTGWVEGVQTNSGIFVKNTSMNSWNVCNTLYNGIPCNWTVQNAN